MHICDELLRGREGYWEGASLSSDLFYMLMYGWHYDASASYIRKCDRARALLCMYLWSMPFDISSENSTGWILDARWIHFLGTHLTYISICIMSYHQMKTVSANIRFKVKNQMFSPVWFSQSSDVWHLLEFLNLHLPSSLFPSEVFSLMPSSDSEGTRVRVQIENRPRRQFSLWWYSFENGAYYSNTSHLKLCSEHCNYLFAIWKCITIRSFSPR